MMLMSLLLLETNTWFKPSLGDNSFFNCSFHNGNQYLVYNKWDGGGVSKWKRESLRIF